MQVLTLLQEIKEVEHLTEEVTNEAEKAPIVIEEEVEIEVEDGITNLLQQANVHQATTFYATPEVVCDPAWYTDSGATNHVTSNLNNLHLPTKYKGNDRLAVGNGQQLQISHTGKHYQAKSFFFLCLDC
ncbi:hypothetical protein ACOSP7_027949 [Xanthoceras sorbifolium]